MPVGLLGDIYLLWRDMDVNKDDKVSWEEWYHGVRFRCKNFNKTELQTIFRNLDGNKTGSVDWLTFQDKLQSIIDRYPHLSDMNNVLERACSEMLLYSPLSRKRPLAVEVMDREMDVIEREKKRVRLMQNELSSDLADRRSLKRQRDRLLVEVEEQDKKRRALAEESRHYRAKTTQEKAALTEETRLTERERNHYRAQTARLERAKDELTSEASELRAARLRDAHDRECMADLSDAALKQAKRAEEERNKWVETAKGAADRITALSDDVRKLKVKKYRLQESLEEQQKEHTQLVASSQEHKEQLEQLENDKLNSKLENAKLVTDRDYYKEQLQEKQDKVEELEKKQAEHQHQLENATSTEEEAHQQELEILVEEMQEKEDRLTASFVEQKQALAQQISKLNAERKQLTVEIEGIGKQRDELSEDADSLRATNATLATEVEKVQNEKEQLAEEHAVTNEELGSIKGQLAAFDEYKGVTDKRWDEFVTERKDSGEKNTTTIIDFLKERQSQEEAQTSSLRDLFDTQSQDALLSAQSRVKTLEENVKHGEIEKERLRRQIAELKNGGDEAMEEPVKEADPAEDPVEKNEQEAQTDVSCGGEPMETDTAEPAPSEDLNIGRDETLVMYRSRLDSANSQLETYRSEVANLRDQLAEHENLKFRLSRLNERYNEISDTVNSYKKTLKIMRDERVQEEKEPVQPTEPTRKSTSRSPSRQDSGPEATAGSQEPSARKSPGSRGNSVASDKPQPSRSADRGVATPGESNDPSGVWKNTD